MKKWLIETEDGEPFEVTNLFDVFGKDTEVVIEADVCVIKFPNGDWQASPIYDRAVHRVQ